MKLMKQIGAALSAIISTVIWLFLLYKILLHIDATEAMWLIYIIYIPVTIFVSVIIAFFTNDD